MEIDILAPRILFAVCVRAVVRTTKSRELGFGVLRIGASARHTSGRRRERAAKRIRAQVALATST